ncbi:MAG: ABC transporter substrate-binding protein [Gordonia sp. (in: high G+C Gram-positive bacteria)]|uniref:ABC transporter substrate-binding protein n=1 Tax=Gordonia sp. (in: high G+C Gram-positive bacteria) TaxID=84139 RepID=UPI0039E346EA
MSTRRLGAFLALVAALLLALTACVKTDEGGDNKIYDDPSADPGFSLPENPRVIGLGWSDGAIALELGVKPIAIYDWMAFADATKGVGEWDAPAFGADEPTLISAQSQGEFNYQQLEELKPDLILNVRAKADQKVTDRLAQIAPVVTAPEGSGDFAVNWKTQTELIGKALGKGDAAEKLIGETESTSNRLKSENPDFAGKTFVNAVKFGTAYGAYLAGDARFDVFAALGFTQNPPVEKLESSGFFASVPVERVADLNAQVALLSTISLPVADLQGDQRLNSLAVVRDGRAVTIPETDPANKGLSAGTPVSLKFSLEQIVPKLAAAVSKL